MGGAEKQKSGKMDWKEEKKRKAKKREVKSKKKRGEKQEKERRKAKKIEKCKKGRDCPKKRTIEEVGRRTFKQMGERSRISLDMHYPL